MHFVNTFFNILNSVIFFKELLLFFYSESKIFEQLNSLTSEMAKYSNNCLESKNTALNQKTSIRKYQLAYLDIVFFPPCNLSLLPLNTVFAYVNVLQKQRL